MEIQAYFEEWSRSPGDPVRMAISTAFPSVRATFVRLVSGPGRHGHPEGLTEDHAVVLDADVPGRLHATAVGSHACLFLPGPVPAGPLSVHCWVWPTATTRDEDQTIWCLGDLRLVLAGGLFCVKTGDAAVAIIEKPAVANQWYSVLVTITADRATLHASRLGGKVGMRQSATGLPSASPTADRILLAASGVDEVGSPVTPFNGKIDTPSLFTVALVPEDLDGPALPSPWAAWHLGQDFASDRIAPAFQGRPGELFNGAERGVTGRNWNGTSDSFLEQPAHYAALQFHDDDMVEAGWAYDLSFVLPPDLASGIYAVRLQAGTIKTHVPLFVRGRPASTAPVLFLAPTNTYLAYANDHLAALDFSSVMPHEKIVAPDEQYLFDHAEPGRSCYDTHSDGTPVRYSSHRRPLFNVRPDVPNWLTGSYRHFPVDMFLIEWLEHAGLGYHVATDEDLERDGRALLDRYKVIVTGSHPEYWTRGGLDIVDGYLNAGGRLMYLGGNGFYWVTSRFADRPSVIEVRRDNSGTRCWDAPYGERTHVATAEAGGIWRTRGRAPNKMLGVGFASEGWSKGCGYKRLPASYQAPYATFFEGVGEEVVGDAGFVLGGAVGDEVDRFDVALGSPEHACVLATSTGLGNAYQLVIEDMTLSLPEQGGAQRPDKVCADMVIFPIDGGGAVFSVGSITYAGALAWNGCDNGLARLTANVLRAFAADGPVLPSSQ